MSSTTVITVSVSDITFSYSTGSYELAEMFRVAQMNTEKKFRDWEAFNEVGSVLTDFLRRYPRNKRIQFILDEMEAAEEVWKKIHEDHPDHPFQMTATVRLEN